MSPSISTRSGTRSASAPALAAALPRPAICSSTDVTTAGPSNSRRHRRNGSTQTNRSGPAPRILGRPCSSATGWGGSLAYASSTRPPGSARFNVAISAVSQVAPTASTATRGRPTCPWSSQTHIDVPSRYVGTVGVAAVTSSADPSSPPVTSIAMRGSRLERLEFSVQYRRDLGVVAGRAGNGGHRPERLRARRLATRPRAAARRRRRRPARRRQPGDDRGGRRESADRPACSSSTGTRSTPSRITPSSAP